MCYGLSDEELISNEKCLELIEDEMDVDKLYYHQPIQLIINSILISLDSKNIDEKKLKMYEGIEFYKKTEINKNLKFQLRYAIDNGLDLISNAMAADLTKKAYKIAISLTFLLFSLV